MSQPYLKTYQMIYNFCVSPSILLSLAHACLCLAYALLTHSHHQSTQHPVVFSALETFKVHRTSPKHQLMMHNHHPIPYYWSICSKRRNKLQHILNGNIEKDEIQKFCQKLKFNDIQTLVTELQNRFTDVKKWSTREPNTDRKSTRLNSSHSQQSRMPSSA